MLTAIALLFFPVVLGMSLYRLLQLPRDLVGGRKWLNGRHRLAAAIGAGLSYCALAVYTAHLLATLAAVVLRPPRTFADALSVASVLVGYPFVYLAYEWVYHYAFDPRPTRY